jgi:hypothetical protein
VARVEAVTNTSTVVLGVVGDEKGTHCLGLQLDHPVPGGNKYEDLDLHVGGVSNLRQRNMVMSPAGLGLENDCARGGPDAVVNDRLVLSSEMALHINKPTTV